MTFKWRKWNKAIHRDFGYFFFGMTLIYAISGIALNHLDDWDPKFVINTREIQTANLSKDIDKEAVLNLLELYGEKENYKKHYFPSKGNI